MLRHLVAPIALLALLHAMAPTAAAQARRLREIEVREEPAADLLGELVPPLPEREACNDAVRRIAAAYGDAELADYLSDDFPNRAELLDALDRAAQRVSNLELRIESIESTRVLEWRVAERSEVDDGTTYELTSDCVVDVRARAVFDGSTSGRRVVTDPVRDEWRLRFTAIVTVQEDGR